METPQLSSLYQQLILEHYRNPRNKGELEEKTVEIHMANPVCGDEIRLQLRIEGDRIEDVKFLGSCLLYTSPSPRDRTRSRMPSSA